VFSILQPTGTGQFRATGSFRSAGEYSSALETAEEEIPAVSHLHGLISLEIASLWKAEFSPFESASAIF
jgi:hypothetical protein